MAKKNVSMQELIARKEELNKTSQLLSEKFQNLQNEVSTTEKQIHMVNGALNVFKSYNDLEKALAGLPLYVARRDDEVEYFKDLLERKRIKMIKTPDPCQQTVEQDLGSRR